MCRSEAIKNAFAQMRLSEDFKDALQQRFVNQELLKTALRPYKEELLKNVDACREKLALYHASGNGE